MGLGIRRLQTDRSGPFLTSSHSVNTVFLSHSWAMGLQIRQKLSSLGPILASPLIQQAVMRLATWLAVIVRELQ